jgi:hypothetical protein
MLLSVCLDLLIINKKKVDFVVDGVRAGWFAAPHGFQTPILVI